MEAIDGTGTDGVHREDAEAAVPTTFPTTSSQDVLMAGVFLLQRLDELGWSEPKDLEREWHGHIEPAIARFRMAIANQPDSPSAADYEAVLEDHRRLARELDILLNGERGAAAQASLCDIVAQMKSWTPPSALTYAQRLATYAASLYGPPEGWRPMNDLMSALDQISNALSGLETPGGRWLPFSENAKVAREFIAYRPDAGTFAAVWIYPPHEDGDGSLDLEAEPTLFTAAGEDISGDPPTFWQPMPTYMED